MNQWKRTFFIVSVGSLRCDLYAAGCRNHRLQERGKWEGSENLLLGSPLCRRVSRLNLMGNVR